MSKHKKKRRAADAQKATGAAENRGARLAREALRHAHPDMAEQLASLTEEEAATFMLMVDRALKKRRILLAGYIATFLCMVGGIALVFYVYSTREPGEVVSWMLLLPFLVVGLVLFGFGRWARRL